MSSTNGQPPLTRRQVRDLERAREAGEAITGSISVVSGSPVPSAMPVTSPQPATPSAARPATPPASGSPTAGVPTAGEPASTAPASGASVSHSPTRRELRAQRDAAVDTSRGPVPLKPPEPAAERNLSDALSHVADIEKSNRDRSGREPLQSSAGGAPEAPVPPLPTPSSADEPAPGPRRKGGATPTASSGAASPVGPSGASAAGPRTPPPSSVPGVFPLALSTASGGSAPTPGSSAPTPGSRPSPARPSAASGSVPASMPQPSPTPTRSREASSAPSAAAAAMQAAVEQTGQHAPVAPASAPQPSGYVRPVGHWSTQADRDDEAIHPGESRVGSPTGQQNAIILNDDSLPDVTGALNATGEVIITGSIDLPRSLAATGSHHIQRIDGAEIDRMLEEGDRESPDSDASPVRASRAVSANTSTRAVVLTAGAKKSNRLPIILGICGAVVIVGIVVVVVASFARGLL